MTIPVERMRALRWGYELLQEMGQDQSLPEWARARASALQVVYPVPHALAQHVVNERGGLPKPWADAMSEALELFENVSFSGQGSVRTRRSLLFTRRHYPDRALIQLLAKGDLMSHWLFDRAAQEAAATCQACGVGGATRGGEVRLSTLCDSCRALQDE